MIYAHTYLDGELLAKRMLSECPRVGDTVRHGGTENESYATVTEVIWCFDEGVPGYTATECNRVNLRLESEPVKQQGGGQ